MRCILVVAALLQLTTAKSERLGRCKTESLKVCKCGLDPVLNHRIVDCSGTGMTSVPTGIPLDTTHLYLDGNDISFLESESFSPGLPKLIVLSLRSNNMTNLTTDSLVGLESLKELDLFNNSLESTFPASVFHPVSQSLQILDIRNNLRSLDPGSLNYPVSVAENHRLKELRLDCVRNKSLPGKYKKLKHLQKIVFSDGRQDVKFLHPAIFNSVSSSSIVDIELSGVGISMVWSNTFSELQTLKKLDLSYNPDLHSRILNVIQSLQSTQIADLSLNDTGLGLAEIPEKKILEALCSLNKTLKCLCLDHNSIYTFDVDVRTCLPNLELLSLADNFFPITRNIIYNVFMLKHLVGYNYSWQETVTNEEKGQLHNSLNESRLHFCEKGQACPIILPPNLRWIDASHNGVHFVLFPELAFLSNSTLEHLEVTHSGIQTMKYPIYCPPDWNIQINVKFGNFSANAFRCINSTVFDQSVTSCDWGSLQYVYLRSNQFGSIDGNECNKDKTDVLGFLKPLHNLRELDLSHNRLDSDSNISVLEHLNQLQLLDLSYNKIAVLSLNLSHFKMLNTLVLSHNQIQCLSKSTLHQLNALVQSRPPRKAFKIDISGNIFSCSCECVHFFDWMVNTKAHLLHKKRYQCYFKTDELYTIKNMMDVDNRLRLLCYGTRWFTIYMLAELIVFMLTTTLTLLFRIRHSVWYVYLKIKINRNKLKALLSQKKCIFSAFISCDARDVKWFVRNKLLPELETEDTQFKFCLAQRDFLVGATIVDNIYKAIHSSMKTICIVSQNFLQSNWCKEELIMAHQVSLFWSSIFRSDIF